MRRLLLFNATICFCAVARASTAACGQPLLIAYWLRSFPGCRLVPTTLCPAQYSAEPLKEIETGPVAPVLLPCIRSTTRPPQPLLDELLGTPDCICTTWSECENSCVGSG